MHLMVLFCAVLLLAAVLCTFAVENTGNDADPDAPAPVLPVPTPAQLCWQRHELTLFLHFGINTFTDREWGDGQESPGVFNPTALDAWQWARVAREAGFKLLLLTAKHHDGFCLWPSGYTEHSVKSSPWKNGQGDVVGEFVRACRAEGLAVGLYLSPWDRNSAVYGSDAYNDYFVSQLTELLTRYGTIDEMWFDGANGEGPNGKRQVYDWDRYFATIRHLMPNALIAITGPDIRWGGNESGLARRGETSVQPSDVPGAPARWYPAECDVSLRPGWFYHASEDDQVKPLAHLMDIYFKSVGRNSVLLLNVPPDRRGLLAEPDVARLREFGAAVRGVSENPVTRDAKVTGPARDPQSRFGPHCALDGNPDTYWCPPDDVTQATLDVDLGTPQPFNTISVGEAIALGERVQAYHIAVEQDGDWQIVARGTVIGQRALHCLPTLTAQRLRLVIESSRACPTIADFAASMAPVTPPAIAPPPDLLSWDKPVLASATYSDEYAAGNAVDGDPASRWATPDETRACWLEVDLGQGRHFDRVRLRERTPRITRFALRYRFNLTDPWQTAFTGAGVGADPVTFPAVMGRYVRLDILDATDAPSLYEWGIYAAREDTA